MTIFCIVSSTIAFVSLQSFTNSNLEQEEMLIVTVLQKARSESMNGVCSRPCLDSTHGVYIDDSSIVLFKGKTFSKSDPQNRTFQHLIKIHISSTTDIYFPGPPASITITENDKTATISVSANEVIDWTL